MASEHEELMRQTIAMAVRNVEEGKGGPFSAIVVKDGVVISTGVNLVTSSNDPTAHAEIVAIRDACKKLGSFQLQDCEIYASCEPCPMCLGAIYWAHMTKFYFACSREDAAAVQFDDSFIYDELNLDPAARSIPGFRLLAEEGLQPFAAWSSSQKKTIY